MISRESLFASFALLQAATDASMQVPGHSFAATEISRMSSGVGVLGAAGNFWARSLASLCMSLYESTYGLGGFNDESRRIVESHTEAVMSIATTSLVVGIGGSGLDGVQLTAADLAFLWEDEFRESIEISSKSIPGTDLTISDLVQFDASCNMVAACCARYIERCYGLPEEGEDIGDDVKSAASGLVLTAISFGIGFAACAKVRAEKRISETDRAVP